MGKKILFYMIVFVGVLAWLTVFVLQDNTMIAWWKPLAIGLIITAAAGICMWRWWRGLTGRNGFVLNYLFNLAFTGGMLLATFYILNFACADRETAHVEKGVIERRFSKERHRTRRV